MKIKGYKVDPVIFIFIFGIILNAVFFLLTRQLVNIFFESIFVYILATRWTVMVKRIPKEEKPDFEKFRIDK